MSRTYSFDHFKAMTATPFTAARPLSSGGASLRHALPSYGRKQAQTIELFQAHQMERELEKLAFKPPTPKRKHAAKKSTSRKSASSRSRTTSRAKRAPTARRGSKSHR